MGTNLPKLLVVASCKELVSRYANLIRTSGIDEVETIIVTPQKGIASFIDSLKNSNHRNLTMFLIADVFSNIEPRPKLEHVVKILLMDISLGLRIFVVRSRNMGEFDPQTMLNVGATGVYYGDEIEYKEFQGWVKRVWKKDGTSIFVEQPKKAQKPETNPKPNPSTKQQEGGKGEPQKPSPDSAKKGESNHPKVQPATKLSPSSTCRALQGELPPVPGTASSWLFAAPKPLPLQHEEKKDEVSQPSTTETPATTERVEDTPKPAPAPAKALTEERPTKTGEQEMLLDSKNQRTLLLALAAAAKAFGEVIEHQLNDRNNQPGQPTGSTVKTAAVSTTSLQSSPSGPAEVKLEIIDGKHTHFVYRQWDFVLPKERALLFRMFIESEGRLITFEEIRNKFKLSAQQRDFSARQKVDQFIAGLENLIPGITQQFKVDKWEGCRFTLPK